MLQIVNEIIINIEIIFYIIDKVIVISASLDISRVLI